MATVKGTEKRPEGVSTVQRSSFIWAFQILEHGRFGETKETIGGSIVVKAASVDEAGPFPGRYTMNIVLWILQVLLALHTTVGAVWKFSNSEQTVPSLSAIPHGVWMAMSIIELLCAVCLILPAMSKRLGSLAPIAASYIAAEMLIFCGFDIFSRQPDYGHVVYWLVVAIVCGFIAYGRFVLKPLSSMTNEKVVE